MFSDVSPGTLYPGMEWQAEDFVYSLSQGYHTIALDIDPQNLIDEHDETDNYYERTIYCEYPTIVFSGYLQYEDPNPGAVSPKPMRGVTIQLWDSDLSSDDLLDEDVTFSDGFFQLVADNVDPLAGRQDPYFKIFAGTDAAFVTQSQGGNTYVFQTPDADNIYSGEYDTTIVADTSESGPFYIVDVLKNTRDTWIGWPSTYDPGVVEVVLNGTGGSHYLPIPAGYIHINNSVFDVNRWPDTYDAGVLLHEYGHRIADVSSFFTASGGGYHEWDQNTTKGLASSEGFATFFVCVLTGDNRFYDLYNNFLDTFWVDCENGEFGENSQTGGSANNYTDNCEGAVAGMLWDIYDSDPQGTPVFDDYSTFGVWPYPYFSIPDGVGDTLWNGIDNILSDLLTRTVSGHPPDYMDDFWEAWFQVPSMDHEKAMRDIWYEHGVQKGCCFGMKGDVNGDGSETADVSDLTYLIAYVFQGGPPPPCMLEADVTGDGAVDISDVTYLVAFLFNQGPAPVACPTKKGSLVNLD